MNVFTTNFPNLFRFLLAFFSKKARLFSNFNLIYLFILGGMMLSTIGCAPSRIAASHGRGLLLDDGIFSKIRVFMRLDSVQSSLPPAVSLKQFCPTPRNQGDQESCIGWATAYTARTVWEAENRHASPNSMVFSPAYLYNQIQTGGCAASNMKKALETLSQGLLPLKDFPYNEKDCSRKPSDEDKLRAAPYKIVSFQRLTRSDTDSGIDMEAIKQNLSQGVPVVIGSLITDSFTELQDDTWKPTTSDEVLGGHAMCVIGYDNAKEGGAFQVMNSWGADWADKGFVWIRYDDFSRFVKESYAFFVEKPEENTAKKSQNDMPLSLQIALRDTTTHNYIPLQRQADGYTFAPVEEVKDALRFRVEVQNQHPCFIHVFRRTVANQQEILYPYSPLYSAYCGIIGKRLFPHNRVLTLNGKQDSEEIAIVASRKELDYEALNEQIKHAKGSYSQRIAQVFGLSKTKTQVTINGNFLELQPFSAKDSIAVALLNVQKVPVSAPAPAKAIALEETDKIDTIFVSIVNKQVRNGYLEFDIATRGARLRGGANYLSSLEVEMEFDPAMYNAKTASEPIVLSAGKNFDQATLVGKNWLPSYEQKLRIIGANRIRASMIMRDYNGAQHIRGSLANTQVQALHLRIPLKNSTVKSSHLHLVENTNITVGTYVMEINASFGASTCFLKHVFVGSSGENDL